MKDEIAQLIADCDTFRQVCAIVDDWMDYYDNDRYQWDLEKLSPREYYAYTRAGVYPLQIPFSGMVGSVASVIPDFWSLCFFRVISFDSKGVHVAFWCGKFKLLIRQVP